MQQRQLLQKRSSQAAAPMEGKRRRSSGDTLEDPLWAKAWESVLRKKAILKGLDQVFLLAQANDNFALFGNDILQCFYDVATVSTSLKTLPTLSILDLASSKKGK